MLTLKRELKITHFVLLLSAFNFLSFHFPFFSFVFKNIDYKSLNGITIVVSLGILLLILNSFIFYLVFYMSKAVGKTFLILFLILNAAAVYFVNTYGVIIDESMIGNVFNTNYEESSSFFSFKILLYIILLGILPSIYVFRVKIISVPFKQFIITTTLTLVFVTVLVFANAFNWLWIDKNSKQLGGLAMPWSYTINSVLYYKHKQQKNEKEILLPNATIANNDKAVVVLVIGESARSKNFSLYGYNKNTNPLLSKTADVFHFPATSCATYTTAGLKCILEHATTDELYEILPNYLYRNNIEVIWKSTNWGEPPLHIKNKFNKDALIADCKGGECEYDEILVKGLKEDIQASKKNKILLVLHTSTSHGPTYSKKYPPHFEIFKPVCNSVELGKCSQTELINAYDNTIVYTDYILSRIIEDLKQLKDYKSTMLFISDHGESLGEKNLYMHGVPMSFAPREQYEIPFIVWSSENGKKLKPNKSLTQNHVFHSVLNFLDIKSPVYKEELNIYQ